MDEATSNNHKYPDYPSIQYEPPSSQRPATIQPYARTRPNVTQTKRQHLTHRDFISHLQSQIRCRTSVPRVSPSESASPLPPPRCAVLPPKMMLLWGRPKKKSGYNKTHQSRASSSSSSLILPDQEDGNRKHPNPQGNHRETVCCIGYYYLACTEAQRWKLGEELLPGDSLPFVLACVRFGTS